MARQKPEPSLSLPQFCPGNGDHLSDEMDPIRGTCNAELAEDGSLDVEISFHLGDEMQFKAQRW